MKKIVTFILVVFTSLAATSQITVTDVDIMDVGDVIYMAYDNTPTISVGNSGANQVWDFSSLQVSSSEVIDILSPNNTPHVSSYPSSNVCVEVNGDFLYFNKSSTGILALGQGDSVFQQPTMFMPLPLTYGMNHVDGPVAIIDSLIGGPTVNLLLSSQGLSAMLLTFGAAQVADSINILVNMTNTFDVDAFGTVNMPNGSYDALRVQTTIQTSSDVLVYCTDTLTGLGSGWYPTPFTSASTEQGYYFMSNDPAIRFALVDIALDSALNIEEVAFLTSPASTVVMDLEKNGLKIFPIPSSYDINISSDGIVKCKYFEIFNLSGQVVLSEEFDNNTKFDVSSLKKSTYILKVYTDQGVAQKKIVIQ
tara:strand:+ start:802 stop:1893 length:1092 start_codon:yes stop_codon:yes gene_type:complete